MKFWTPLFLLAGICLPVLADTDQGNKGRDEEAIGSMPRTTKVLPGKCASNNAGVTVCTKVGSGGNARLTPATGTSGDTSTVSTQANWEGSASGLKAGDTANCGHHSKGKISGNGGTVNVASSSTVTVSHMGGSSGPITVNHPGPGSPTLLYSGQNGTF